MLQRGQDIQALVQSGQYERARNELLKLLKNEPRSAEVLNGLAVVDAYLGNLSRSLYYSEMAVKYAPDNAVVWRTHANTLCQVGKFEASAEAFDRIIKLTPGDAAAWLGRSSVERYRDNFEGTVDILKQGLKAAGEHESLLAALVRAESNCGRTGPALEMCEAALKRFPGSLELASLACNTSQNVGGISPERVFAIHKRYGEMMLRGFPPPAVKYVNTAEPERKLRIGFVSSDLRRHSVAFFMEPLLAELDRSQFQVNAYSTSRDSDVITQRLKSLVETWREVAAFGDAQLSERIYADQIDILIDLHGHTLGHRMGVFHNKPAPVQMTYLGYPNTTGLKSIDYRIVDERTDPAGMSERFNTEQLLRVESGFLCYTPPTGEDVPELRESEKRPVTFGCFNALPKLSPESIALWSKVLREVPGSRMVLKCPTGSHSLVSGRIMHEFAQCGIDSARIDVLASKKTLREHLEAYMQMDFALDPFPYHGTTTTCEALFMGVPVLSLAGKTHVSRVGASILTATGHPEWIAHSESEFVSLASDLARKGGRGLAQREGLRKEVLGSALCDRARFGQNMAGLLRTAWRTWCKGAAQT